MFEGGWYYIDEAVSSLGQMVRRLQELANVGHGDAHLGEWHFENMTRPAYDRVAGLLGDRRITFRAALPAQAPLPPIERWLFAHEPPSCIAEFRVRGIRVSLVPRHGHPTRGRNEHAIVIEASSNASLRTEFERRFQVVADSLGIPPAVAASFGTRPLARWVDPERGLEVRTDARAFRTDPAFAVYEPAAGIDGSLRRMLALAARLEATTLDVWCRIHPRDLPELRSLGAYLGHWISADDHAKHAPEEDDRVWTHVSSIADLIGGDEVGHAWFKASSGIVPDVVGIQVKRSLVASHSLRGRRALSVLVHVPSGTPLDEAKRRIEAELGVRIGERWPPDDLDRALSTPGPSLERRREIVAALLATIERRVGLPTGSLQAEANGAWPFLVHTFRGLGRLVDHDSLEAIDGWADDHLDELELLRPRLLEMTEAQRLLRKRLAERLAVTEEAIAARPSLGAAMVWTVAQVDERLDAILEFDYLGEASGGG